MQIVIPMSGQGSRFKRAGYTDIKPLIEVDGMPMIEHVVNMFPGEADFLFICANEHLESTPIREVLERIKPTGTIVGVDSKKLGPVYAALAAKEFIKNDEPVVLNYTDFSVGWDYADFKATMERLDPAGCVTAYRGFHPHTLGPNLYAYMRNEGNWMQEIKEKHCFTDNRMEEFASSGTYYFQSGGLLKETFEEAVCREMQTNGEYYASTPYNLLVEKGLPVYIYELTHFLQWGTPEDLEEYQRWSAFFANYADWRADEVSSPGANLIPMAGDGRRFSTQGYSVPKPLVPVVDVPMISRSLRTLPAAERLVCLVRSEHLEHPSLEPTIQAEGKDVSIIRVEKLTEGQACTCLLGMGEVDPEQPVLIAPCDAGFVFDQQRYQELTSDPEVDCLIWTFRNHPHANRNPRQYGWVETDSAQNVTRISCKVPLGDDVTGDPGIIGAFWFRKARFFQEAAEELIRQNRRVNNEFYADTAIEVLVEQGRRAKVFDVEHYIGFGTPDDVRTYEYWAEYFTSAPHHPFGKA